MCGNKKAGGINWNWDWDWDWTGDWTGDGDGDGDGNGKEMSFGCVGRKHNMWLWGTGLSISMEEGGIDGTGQCRGNTYLCVPSVHICDPCFDENAEIPQRVATEYRWYERLG
jgi:hypothetical protein